MTTVVETVALKRDECFRCGYALVGIAGDQPCPECGLLAARSRRATDELHLARPAWLRRLSIGTWLILAAITWPVVWTILWILIAGPLQQLPAVQKVSFSRVGRLSGASTAPPAGARMFSSLGWADAVVFLERHPQAGWSLSAALLIAGAACFARREGHESADRADHWLRLLLLASSAAPAITLVVWTQTERSVAFMEPAFDPPSRSAVLLATIGCAPFPVLLFFQLRSLARRARNSSLAEHCAIVGIGSAAALATSAVTYGLSRSGRLFFEETWQRMKGASLLVATLLETASLFFYLWGIWLLIRFARAFRSAAEQARIDWKRDDRSAG